MNKFALLVALLITLVAASSAAKLTLTPPAASLIVGTKTTVVFKSDDDITEADPEVFSYDVPDSKFFILDGISGNGSGTVWCSVGTTNVAYYQLRGSKFELTTVAAIAKDTDEITCPVRIGYDLKADDYKFKVESDVDFTIDALPTTAKFTAGVDGTKATFTAEGFPANILVPITFKYALAADLDKDGNDLDPIYQLWAADFTTNLGNGYRLYAPDGDNYYLVTDTTVSSTASFSLTFPEASYYSYTKDNVDKSIYYGIEWATEKGKEEVASVAGGKVPPQELRAIARVTTPDSKLITYSFTIPTVFAEKPTLKINFDTKFDIASYVFGAGSKLTYTFKGNDAPITLTLPEDKVPTWTLDKLAANAENVVIVGSFTPSEISNFGVSFECAEWSGSDKLTARAAVSSVKITEASETMLKYTFKVSVDGFFSKFTGPVDFNLVAEIEHNAQSEIRKNGAFLPSCTVEGADISQIARTADGVDAGRQFLRVKGSFDDVTKSAEVSCEQELNSGAKLAKDLQVTVAGAKSQTFSATWPKVTLINQKDGATINFHQIVDIYGPKVDSSSAFDDFITKAKAAIGDVIDGDFLYVYKNPNTRPVYSYVSQFFGIVAKFDTPSPSLNDFGSHFQFVYKRKGDVVLNNKIWIKDGVEVHVNAVATDKSDVDALSIKTYINGNDDASFGPAQVLFQQEGFKCWSSAQCSGSDVYCYENVCTHFSGLSKAAQTRVLEEFDPDASSALVASISFAFIAIILALIF